MHNHRTENWVAPADIRVPDFMICGAMKCGTTTVHQLIGRHPQVFIPDAEINFFDMDDWLEHNDFVFQSRNGWHAPAIADDPEAYWQWYARFFSKAPDDVLIGEDSTCYLPSRNAPLRISLQEKPVKLIVCLRQPAERAYSQYWHQVRTGRAVASFEDTLRLAPHSVLSRSMYLPQIENLLTHLPRERVFFFILEDFLADRERVVRELLDFLGLSFNDLPDDALSTHSNSGKYPMGVNLRVFMNRVLRVLGNASYRSRLPYDVPTAKAAKLAASFSSLVNKASSLFSTRRAPKMKLETRQILDKMFKRELDGIDELIGANVTSVWFSPNDFD